MTVAGFIWLPEIEDEFDDRPVLAGVAVNHIEQIFAEPLPEIDDLPDENTGVAEGDAQDETGADDDAIDVAEESDEDDSEDIEETEVYDTDESLDDEVKDAEDAEFEARMAELDEAIRRKKERIKNKKRGNKDQDDDKDHYDTDRENPSDGSSSAVDLHYDFIEVGDDYFDDALFIGDSRQQDFGKYCGMDNITVYADRGYQIYDTSTKAITDSTLGKVTVYDALAVNQHRFKKVYIMFGINEMQGGAAQEEMAKYYYRLIKEIKRMQPDAIIYLEGVFHVTKKLSDARAVFSNDRINEKNEILKQVAKDEGVVFLDLNEIPEFTDADGALVPEATDDGMHLHNGYILLIKDYLYKHALEYKYEGDNYPYVELSTLQQQLKEKLDAQKPKQPVTDEEAERIRRQQEQEAKEQERLQKEREAVMADN